MACLSHADEQRRQGLFDEVEPNVKVAEVA